MLAEVPAHVEKAWLGDDDEDLKQLLEDLRWVRLPDDPRRAWARLQILEQVKNCVNALELDPPEPVDSNEAKLDSSFWNVAAGSW